MFETLVASCPDLSVDTLRHFVAENSKKSDGKAEQAREILNKDISLLIKKVNDGEPLTGEQRRRLEAVAQVESPTEPVMVNDQAGLAKALGVSRKSVSRWLKREGCPGAASNGQYNVTKWKLWMDQNDLGRRGRATGGDDDMDPRQAEELKGIRLKNEKAELENQIRRGELVHYDEVNEVLTELLGTFARDLRGQKHTIGQQCSQVTAGEATKRAGVIIEEALTQIALGDWAKKKAFWSKVYAHLSDLHERYNLGLGESVTS